MQEKKSSGFVSKYVAKYDDLPRSKVLSQIVSVLIDANRKGRVVPRHELMEAAFAGIRGPKNDTVKKRDIRFRRAMADASAWTKKYCGFEICSTTNVGIYHTDTVMKK
jgi:hypothetical protein